MVTRKRMGKVLYKDRLPKTHGWEVCKAKQKKKREQ